MSMVVASFVGFEFVDAAVAFLAEVAVEGLPCFAGGFGLRVLPGYSVVSLSFTSKRNARYWRI